MESELPTRQQVLDLLKTNGRMTVKQLSEALGITPMGVRQHLDGLFKEHLVTFEWLRAGRGRPSQIFSLTPKGDELYPRNYGALALSVLNELKDMGGNEVVDQIFARRTAKMKEQYGKHLAELSLEERVEELARIRDSEGYLATFEKVDDNTYRILERNCPVNLVASQFPHACRHEQALFQQLLGDDVIVQREDHIVAGDHQCRYLIKRIT